MKRAAIFFQKYTPFNRDLISAMKRGLEAHGTEVFCGLEYPDESSMIGFCRNFRPDVIFEMNRTRNEVPYLPKEIKHIAWIVDTNGRENSYFSGSDIIYFIGANWLRANSSGSALTEWLPPGVCGESYYYEKAYEDVARELEMNQEEVISIFLNSFGQRPYGEEINKLINKIKERFEK